MSWIDTVLGSDQSGNSGNTKLSDKDIALDLLAMSKNDIGMLSKVIPETTNPEVRQLLSTQLNACIASHFKLSDMLITKGWYNAYGTPQEQIKQDVESANKVLQEQF
ncbi:spore coat protein [Clostridium sp. C8-1-8]|uniref:spore coat protein n=1 Tax=Clostridium sp. C8-1-8 TaxID=2698831 RepID=UPI00136BC0A2|nr:spore coat protein [Clostridium sp. C8-1-8]